MARSLVNLKDVAKGYGSRSVLRDVTLGVAAGDRIGVVGRNGDGKSTLLRLIAGVEAPDAGALTRAGGLGLALLGQGDELVADRTVSAELVGGRLDHEWRGDPAFRGVLEGLLGGVELRRLRGGLDARVQALSGGERRRVALARLLLGGPELLLLDEPTNHLDVEGVDWLARHLAGRRGTLLVVTHDRWFLDAVCTQTWEVTDGGVQQYEGGYAAYVLARAERERQEAARDARRRQLLHKELAWLRRGPPARTSKPKFRIEAANALIEGEPEPRAGAVQRGATVRLAHLSQDTAEIPAHLRVLEALEEVRGRAVLGDGRELTAGMLAERFGFRGDRARTLVRDLSGGERRRLQLMRLLMDEPNVLLLDEPTNDLDIDTLTALEDLLDGWPGTLVVVSHDRYFVERVCDDVHALTETGGIRHLPGGIEQYVALRRAGRGGEEASTPPRRQSARPSGSPPSGAVLRAAR